VLTAGQMLAALVHTTLIAVFFSVLCYLCFQVGWSRRRSPAAQGVTSEPARVTTAP